VTVFLCVSVFLCAVLLMGQVPEIKWIGLDWIGLDWIVGHLIHTMPYIGAIYRPYNGTFYDQLLPILKFLSLPIMRT